MAKKITSIRFNEEKMELAKKETNQPSPQKFIDFILDSIWFKYHPPQGLEFNIATPKEYEGEKVIPIKHDEFALWDSGQEIKGDPKKAFKNTKAKVGYQKFKSQMTSSQPSLADNPKNELLAPKESEVANKAENEELKPPEGLKGLDLRIWWAEQADLRNKNIKNGK